MIELPPATTRLTTKRRAELKGRIPELWALGEGVSQIAQELGLSRGTVYKVLRLGPTNARPGPKPGTGRELASATEVRLRAAMFRGGPAGSSVNWTSADLARLIDQQGTPLSRQGAALYQVRWGIPNSASPVFTASEVMARWWVINQSTIKNHRRGFRDDVLWLADPIPLTVSDWIPPEPERRGSPKITRLYLFSAKGLSNKVYWRVLPNRLTWKQHFQFLNGLQSDLKKNVHCIPVNEKGYQHSRLREELKKRQTRLSNRARSDIFLYSRSIDIDKLLG